MNKVKFLNKTSTPQKPPTLSLQNVKPKPKPVVPFTFEATPTQEEKANKSEYSKKSVQINSKSKSKKDKFSNKIKTEMEKAEHDQELFNEYVTKPIHDESEEELFEELIADKQQGDEAVILDDGNEYEVVDGIKVTPFSLKREMEEGNFDIYGNYHENKYEEEEDYLTSESESDPPPSKDSLEKVLKEIIPLIHPQNTVEEAICESGNDNDRLVKLTDLATTLMALGKLDIYSIPVSDLEKELKSLLQ